MKSVSAFADGVGGSLFFGVSNDKRPVGLSDAQRCGEKISELINQRIDPTPIYFLKPFKEKGKLLIELKVLPGQSTPYYYKADGVCVSYIRAGSESIETPTHILNELILRGQGKTYDGIVTGYKKSEFSFSTLRSVFLERTKTTFNEQDFRSFGLSDKEGHLTNAGILLADENPYRHSRVFCTRWNGLNKVGEKEAADDKTFSGSLLKQLSDALLFWRNNTKIGWHKEGTKTIYDPDYDEEAITEALVNGIIHRDYNNHGAEVCLNIYDDRIEISSPGGMFSGEKIPEKIDFAMESMRRNPIISDLFWKLKYMNERGSGLENITNKTNALFKDGMNHVTFSSTSSFFVVRIANSNYRKEAESDLANRGSGNKQTLLLSPNEKKIIDMIRASETITQAELAAALGVTDRTVRRMIKRLKNEGAIEIVGKTKAKKWFVK
ncbi:MAG: putative DNA binding domain-containing protein [Bacilli bacterium]|nr:putative DNA binding domain-containing protein [Bacilli bacterium]